RFTVLLREAQILPKRSGPLSNVYGNGPIGPTRTTGPDFSCLEQPKRRKEKHKLSTDGTLYVFVHGLTVGHQVGHHVEIVLPSVPGHVCRAGSWLMETDIAPGSTLTLDGVTHGNKHLAD